MLILTSMVSFGQVPQKFNYQGIARDVKGIPLVEKQLSIKLSILPTQDANIVEYEETQFVTTNEFGLYTLQIGNGTSLQGEMKNVKWETGNKYIKVAIDPLGGNNFVDIGTSQLLSVPYAIYADMAGIAKETSNNNGNTRSGSVTTSASGTGTTNYLTKFTAPNTIYNSQVIDNGTNVGIGTASPLYKLHLEKATGNTDVLIKTVDATAASSLRLRNSANAEFGMNKFGPSATGTYMSIPRANMAILNNSPTGPLVLSSGSDLAFGNTVGSTQLPRIFIQGSTGNIGIGTTNPNAKLDVLGNIKITDGTQGAGKVLKSDANGFANWDTLEGPDLLSMPIVTLPTNLSCPNVSGSVTTGNNPASIAVSGNYAYVANESSNSMQVINITNPGSPIVIGSVATGNNPLSVVVSGNYAYVTNYYGNTMQVINITNPASPLVVGSVATGTSPKAIAISGNYAYLVNWNSNTMQVINISNPASPSVVGSVTTGANPNSIAVTGNYAYVVNYGSNTMQVINVSNPASPSVVGSSPTGNSPVSLAVLGNYVYIANNAQITPGSGNYNMQVIDISNPTAPTITGSLATKINGPRALAVSGNYAYLTYNGNIIEVIDISNPASPSKLGSVATGSDPYSVALSGNYAYVVNRQDNAVQVINLECATNYAVTINPANGQTTALQFQWNTNGNNISNANSGNVGIGTTTPTQRLSVNGNICYTGSVGACSDFRYKKNITPLKNSLHQVLLMQGINYDWKVNEFPDKQFNDNNQIGFIAQDLEKLYPELVITDDNGYKSVDYPKLTPILVEAIKELSDRNEKLELESINTNAKLANLEAKLNFILQSTKIAQK